MVQAWLVGNTASDCVVLGPGSHRGRRTPNPAGLPPEQATPGARLPLGTQASVECRHFTEISIFFSVGEVWPKAYPTPPPTSGSVREASI